MEGPLYDKIGTGYSAHRQEEPRIARLVHRALGDARRVINVGAGAGSYEPRDREVIAVEPSTAMIAQRPASAAPVITACAEDLPFADGSFDAAMAVLTVHHWSDPERGLAEMRRIAKGPVVILTFELGHPGTWLGDYLPQLREHDARQAPPYETYRRALGEIEVAPVPIPHDCVDGFLYAFWRRPKAYLDPAVRAATSSFQVLDGLGDGLARLASDLADGEWTRRYGHLLEQREFDAGYRLIVAR